ncbi:hypothetical protein LCGC14_0723870 [marine sediment metagenome]|uniref:Uncharacterized protein n=1 Tax=marine sediment metagenome TaxID=412755 RepID=A0A0F9SWW6_9ZZZZ
MNIILELLRFFSVVLIGIVIVKLYENKKGWEYPFRTSLLSIFIWRTIILVIILSMNLLLDLYLIDFLNNIDFSLYLYIHTIMLVVVSFLISSFLGIKIFKLIYKQDVQESLFITLIIVVVDLVLESIFFYSTLIL